jgi:hypothetical protein
MKIGRNEPCPCGSGLKYKKCCLGKQDAGGKVKVVGDGLDELREMVKGHEFSTVEELSALIDEKTKHRSQAGLDDFQGLSSDQMNRFLYFPFESPQYVSFPEVLDTVPEAPVAKLFLMLAAAVGEDGLKGTATGNLPRNFCRDAALALLGEEGYRQKTSSAGINKEPDFRELHVTRLVAEMAGLVRNSKGRFELTGECRQLMAEAGIAAVYPRLLRSFVQKFNWGYGDGYPDSPMIQQSFAYTLYLLWRFGEDWKPASFYADCFLQAFPLVPDEFRDVPTGTPEETAARCFALRSLDRGAELLGLVEIDHDPDRRLLPAYRVRKLPLLDHVVRFSV